MYITVRNNQIITEHNSHSLLALITSITGEEITRNDYAREVELVPKEKQINPIEKISQILTQEAT